MSEDLVDRLSAPHGYFGRSLRYQAANEIRRLRADLLEEARLNGMGGEREAHLRSQVNVIANVLRKSDAALFAVLYAIRNTTIPEGHPLWAAFDKAEEARRATSDLLTQAAGAKAGGRNE